MLKLGDQMLSMIHSYLSHDDFRKMFVCCKYFSDQRFFDLWKQHSEDATSFQLVFEWKLPLSTFVIDESTLLEYRHDPQASAPAIQSIIIELNELDDLATFQMVTLLNSFPNVKSLEWNGGFRTNFLTIFSQLNWKKLRVLLFLKSCPFRPFYRNFMEFYRLIGSHTNLEEINLNTLNQISLCGAQSQMICEFWKNLSKLKILSLRCVLESYVEIYVNEVLNTIPSLVVLELRDIRIHFPESPLWRLKHKLQGQYKAVCFF